MPLGIWCRHRRRTVVPTCASSISWCGSYVQILTADGIGIRGGGLPTCTPGAFAWLPACVGHSVAGTHPAPTNSRPARVELSATRGPWPLRPTAAITRSSAGCAAASSIRRPSAHTAWSASIDASLLVQQGSYGARRRRSTMQAVRPGLRSPPGRPVSIRNYGVVFFSPPGSAGAPGAAASPPSAASPESLGKNESAHDLP